MTEKKDHTEKDESARVHYELGYLLVPTISEDDVAGEATKVRDSIEKSAAVVSGAAPEMKALAYEIVRHAAGKNQRFNNAYFGHFIFEATREEVGTIREALKKNNSILRSLIISRSKESLVAPVRIPRQSESRVKRVEEKSAPMDETAVDQEIERMVAEVE